jgi:hypothetical protein
MDASIWTKIQNNYQQGEGYLNNSRAVAFSVSVVSNVEFPFYVEEV